MKTCGTECPTKHDSWCKQVKMSSSIIIKLIDTKDSNKDIIWQSYYSKIDFKVKYI